MNFDFRAEAFSEANAAFLGAAAKLAYANKAKVKSTVQTWEMSLIDFFNVQGTQAFLAGDQNTLILSFRGTEPKVLQDWMTDADVLLVNGPVGKVHQGFLCGLNYIWRDLWNLIVEQRGNRTLWVTGHSLGGALATLAVAKIRIENGHPVNGLYTFGQPRVGDAEFASRFDQDFGEKTFRFVNNLDVVPRVPTRKMNYRDNGKLRLFNEFGQLQNEATWAVMLLKYLGDSIKEILQLDEIKDHDMDGYLVNLNKLVESASVRPG